MNSNAWILVVDDNATNRLKMSMAVKHLGYEVDSASNGVEAMAQMRATHFDLILLDLLMPEMDGFDVLNAIRNDSELRDTPVVVVSALEDMQGMIKCIEMGAEDYLPKPFNATLLKARISACIEKKRLREAIIGQLGKYVPESVATSIIRDRGSLQPKRTIATILFTDIENFTSIAESMSPERVFEMLNAYFDTVVGPLMEHGGVVNQFQGDAMLVTFNIPIEDAEHADNAVSAALAMQAVADQTMFADVALKTRVGVNTGELIAGNVGSGSRHNYTVHGDAVNLAARLEQMNKQHGTRILISESTRVLLKSNYNTQSMGKMSVRGRMDDLEVFSVVSQ